VIATAAGTDLSGDPPLVRLADLSAREWLHFTPPSGLADILDEAGAAAGFEPRVAIRTEQASSAVSLASEGLGLTLVPGNVIPATSDGLLLRPDPPVNRHLSVYTRVRSDPITAAFVSAVSDQTFATPEHVRTALQM
jgi:DNA-binding transcriptional LysR family regulator